MRDVHLHIQALFQSVQAEFLIDALNRERNKIPEAPLLLNLERFFTRESGKDYYRKCIRTLLPERSNDEVEQFCRDLEEYLSGQSIFSLLPQYGKEVLRICDGAPVCRQEKLLDWREMSMALGQDLFTCATLAWSDAMEHRVRTSFCWPAAIRSDSAELKSLLRRGLAENHYHLNGSTQSFALTWGFLMNHPEKAERYFSDKKFRFDLHGEPAWGPLTNQLPRKTLILYAAEIRLSLFEKLLAPRLPKADADAEEMDQWMLEDSPDRRGVVRRRASQARFLYGARFPQLDGSSKCLDYAVDPEGGADLDSPLRFLSGERRFLYQCFRACYSGAFCREEQNGLYLYLLIKTKLRGEIIQNNGQYGFRNFSEYQDRKAHIWGYSPDYRAEANRLAISATLHTSVRSLELRVMPGNSRDGLRENIGFPDQVAEFDRKEHCAGKRKRRQRAEEQNRYFYVVHFAKKPLPPVKKGRDNRGVLRARHYALRRTVERQAKVLARTLERDSYLCGRIRGIDAASHEIGCRPEIFATAFRFLRGFTPYGGADSGQPRRWPELNVTYHVGEDFLDIADGMRAVDEAICFLHLESGDRIGHGLALGIEPEDYYALKKRTVILPAQDLLDNLVWLLFRSLEWGVTTPQAFRVRLEKRADELMRRIYMKNCPQADLQKYFQSWFLRGDDPELYFLPRRTDGSMREGPEFSAVQYCRFKRDDDLREIFDGDGLRKDEDIHRLLHRYHYGAHERMEGQKTEIFSIDSDYIQLIRDMQNRMLRRVMEKEICIECNPSSNYLIGTFREYGKHPIFRFNHYGLELPEYPDKATQLRVSVNTDDQGIFDTSLENEYALLYGSLNTRLAPDGARVVSNDAALSYLEHVRDMGRYMTFPKAKKQYLK